MSLLNPTLEPIDNTPELHVAVVVRHDGPVPGLCSTLQLGFAIAGVDDAGVWTEQKAGPSLALAIKPIGLPWASNSHPMAAERDRMAMEGEDAGYAITRATAWLNSQIVALGYQPGAIRVVPVTWPGTFDAAHVLHYFNRHNGLQNPFQASGRRTPEELFSLCADARTRLTSPVRVRKPARSARPVDALDNA